MDEELTEVSTQTDTETIMGFLLIIVNAVLSYHVATEGLGSAEVFGFWLARVVLIPAIVVFLFSLCVKNATARKKWAVMTATQFAIILANIGAMSYLCITSGCRYAAQKACGWDDLRYAPAAPKPGVM